MDFTQLKNDINTNPDVASFIGQSDQAVADYYNDPTGNGAMMVASTLIEKDDFIKKSLPAVARLQQGLQADGKTPIDPQKKAFWLAIFNYLIASNSFDPTLITSTGNAVTDGVFSQAELDAITTKKVSRAEGLTGQTITIDDVSKALGLATFTAIGENALPVTTLIQPL